MSKLARVLFVDDEINLLKGIKRSLYKDYQLTLANGAREALEILEKEPPFAVVVSDMRMPGMNGIEFLKICHEKYPDMIRMMLTGNADLETAVVAVNKGAIFRFMNKPCRSEDLKYSIEACLEQWQLIQSEKLLLEKTLRGSIEALMHILEAACPLAFSRATRIKNTANNIFKQIFKRSYWALDVAALLSQIGCVTLPPETMAKLTGGKNLTETDKAMMKSIPDVAIETLSHIPKMEIIANIIDAAFHEQTAESNSTNSFTKEQKLCGQILRLAEAIELLRVRGIMGPEIKKSLLLEFSHFSSTVLNALKSLNFNEVQGAIVERLRAEELTDHHIIAEDILTTNGLLLVGHGQSVTKILRLRLKNYTDQHLIDPLIPAFIPHQTGDEHEYI